MRISSTLPTTQGVSETPKPALKAVANNLAGRVNVRWQNIVMIAGVAIAIIGIIVTLITGAYFYTAAFALLGAVSGFGYSYVREYAGMQTINKDVEDLKKANAKLQDSEKKLIASNDKLSEDFKKLTTQYDALDKDFKALQELNKKVQLENQQFQKSVQELSTENEALGKTKVELQQKVSQFDQDVAALKQQLDEFSSHQEQLGKTVASFGKDVVDLGHEGTKLDQEVQSFDTIVNDDIRNLAKQIASAKAASSKIFSSMQTQLSSLQKENANLSAAHQSLQSDAAKLQQELTALQELQKQKAETIKTITEETDRSKSAIAKDKEEEKKEEGDLQALKQEVELLGKKRVELQQDVEKAEKIISNYTEQMKQYQEAEENITKSINAKLAQKKSLQADVERLKKERATGC